jgi:hypothetical protein
MNIKLNDNHFLGIEPYKTKAILVAWNNGTQLACRIETIKNLSKFIDEQEANIFKGRLKLYKHQDSIAVQVKENTIGVLTASQFEGLLKSIKR